MRVLLLVLCSFAFCTCNRIHEGDVKASKGGRYLVDVKDSVLLQTIREYIDTLNLHQDSTIISVYETSCSDKHEIVFKIDYNQFEDFVIHQNQIPSYYSFVDSTLVTVYNNSYLYIGSGGIENEIRNIVKKSIHLKKWNEEMYDAPLWKVSIVNDSISVKKSMRR